MTLALAEPGGERGAFGGGLGRDPQAAPGRADAGQDACWIACGRRARTSRPPRWTFGCTRPTGSGSSSSSRAMRISSGSDARPTAPRPRHGAGKIWTYGLVLNTAPGAETEKMTRTTAALTV